MSEARRATPRPPQRNTRAATGAGSAKCNLAIRRPDRYRDAYRLAFAAGWDAGNRSAARAGRIAWNEQDRDAATSTMLGILRNWEFDPTAD